MCQTRFKLKIGRGGTFSFKCLLQTCTKTAQSKSVPPKHPTTNTTHNRNDNDKVKKFVVNIFNNFMEQIILNVTFRGHVTKELVSLRYLLIQSVSKSIYKFEIFMPFFLDN